jgi:hypothetical protein
MIVMISKYIWLIAILYKYRTPLCVLHQAKINSGTGLAALHARRHFLPVHELGTGPVHAVTQPAADGSGRSSRGRRRRGSQSRARTHVGGGWPARPGHPPRWGRPRLLSARVRRCGRAAAWMSGCAGPGVGFWAPDSTGR